MTAETVGALGRLVAGVQAGLLRSIIWDQARDQRCVLGQAVAHAYGRAGLRWPSDSPTLKLIER